jgi:DNA-binding MarR family transcriptional regulator
MRDDEVIDLWGRVIRGVGLANKRLHARIRKEFALNEAEVDTVITLGGLAGGRETMAALAASASFTTGGYTKVADRLTDRNILRRVPDIDDRRVIHLELTPAGAQLADGLRSLVAQFLRAEILAVLGEERARVLADSSDELQTVQDGTTPPAP